MPLSLTMVLMIVSSASQTGCTDFYIGCVSTHTLSTPLPHPTRRRFGPCTAQRRLVADRPRRATRSASRPGAPLKWRPLRSHGERGRQQPTPAGPQLRSRACNCVRAGAHCWHCGGVPRWWCVGVHLRAGRAVDSCGHALLLHGDNEHGAHRRL